MSGPDRVMLAPNGGLPTGNYPKSELVEYHRADLTEARIAAAVKAAILYVVAQATVPSSFDGSPLPVPEPWREAIRDLATDDAFMARIVKGA